MAKSKNKKAKAKRFVGSTAMDVVQEPAPAAPAPQLDGMDTSEIVVTEDTRAGNAFPLAGRVSKKGVQKRKALKLRKEKALKKAISMIDKQERRVTKAELKKYGKQELKRMG